MSKRFGRMLFEILLFQFYLAGSFRPLKRSISEAKNKGLGSSQQAKISARQQAGNGDFAEV